MMNRGSCSATIGSLKDISHHFFLEPYSPILSHPEPTYHLFSAQKSHLRRLRLLSIPDSGVPSGISDGFNTRTRLPSSQIQPTCHSFSQLDSY